MEVLPPDNFFIFCQKFKVFLCALDGPRIFVLGSQNTQQTRTSIQVYLGHWILIRKLRHECIFCDGGTVS